MESRAIRNPLALFGFVLLAGDSPLTAAYIAVHDPVQSWVLLIAIVLFTFGMAAWFWSLVWSRPQHLYAPQDFPRFTIENSPYGVNFPLPVLKRMRDEIVAETSKSNHELVAEIKNTLAGQGGVTNPKIDNVEQAFRSQLRNEHYETFLRTTADQLKEQYRQRLLRELEIEVSSFVRSSFNPDFIAIEELIRDGFCRIERLRVDPETGTEVIKLLLVSERE